MSQPYHDRETLKEDLEKLGTQTAVAEKYGVSQATIGWFTRKFDIEHQDWSVDSWEDEETPWRNREKFQQMADKHRSISKMAEDWECTRKTVSRWEEKHGIEASFWDGSGPETPYPENWTTVANEIRERDSHCRKCGEDPNYTLHVHHIVPLIEFEDPHEANDPDNLVTVCRPCHKELESLPEKEQRELLQ